MTDCAMFTSSSHSVTAPEMADARTPKMPDRMFEFERISYHQLDDMQYNNSCVLCVYRCGYRSVISTFCMYRCVYVIQFLPFQNVKCLFHHLPEKARNNANENWVQAAGKSRENILVIERGLLYSKQV